MASERNEHFFYKINLAQRLLMKNVDQKMKKDVKVSATQAAALIYLGKNQGALLVDLSRELLQNKSAITTLVDRMEKNGFLEKRPSEMDKRASQLFLTPKGYSLYKQSLVFAKTYNDQLSSGFTPQELEIIDRFLNSIIAEYQNEPTNFFFNVVE